MRRTPAYSHHRRFKESRTTGLFENLSASISESLTDLHLPEELITEILLRLPVNSLLKFKCVSKLWLSLISTPQFIRSHLSTSSKEGEYLNHRILFTRYPSLRMKQCSLYSALHEAEPSRHISDIEYPYWNPDNSPWIIGIINGLVCSAGYETFDLVLWNPVLRKFKLLQGSNIILQPALGLGKARLSVNDSFGYDESNDDYKVVRLLKQINLHNWEGVFESEDKVYSMVYSLRADSWKRIDDLNGFRLTHHNHSGIYANGKIYWSSCVPGVSTPKSKMVSLDMVTEKYGEVQLPDCEPGYYDWRLGVLGERPLVVCDYKGTKKDLWVMNKYGVEESWYRMVSIPYADVHPPIPDSPSQQQVLCILSNGEIVLDSGHGLLVYHSKHKEYRNIELVGGSCSYFEVVAYVESLVWPN